MPPTRTLPMDKKLDSRSGIVRHSTTVVALEHALARVPQTTRVEVVLEHDQTGVANRTTWNRIAVCVALQKGSTRYGIYETLGRAKQEGFGLVTRHPTLAHTFLFIDTRPAAPEAP